MLSDLQYVRVCVLVSCHRVACCNLWVIFIIQYVCLHWWMEYAFHMHGAWYFGCDICVDECSKSLSKIHMRCWVMYRMWVLVNGMCSTYGEWYFRCYVLLSAVKYIHYTVYICWVIYRIWVLLSGKRSIQYMWWVIFIKKECLWDTSVGQV